MCKINVYDKIVIENQKKRENNGNPSNFNFYIIMYPSKRWFGNGIHSLLKRVYTRERERESTEIICRM